MSATQRLFNKVARHLLKQGERAFDPLSETCLYRAPDGKKCAVGCLISDREYQKEMEQKDVRGLLTGGFKLPKVITENPEILSRLQTIHDTHAPSKWRESLGEFARASGLNTKALT